MQAEEAARGEVYVDVDVDEEPHAPAESVDPDTPADP
jgi:hypothetical protein